MQTASKKAKGRRLQDWLRERWLNLFALPPEQVRTRIMGEKGSDVYVTDPNFDLAAECKNQESIQIWKALEQAALGAGPNKIGLLVFKRNRSPVYVALKWDDFERILGLHPKFFWFLRVEHAGPTWRELRELYHVKMDRAIVESRTI